jgi:hypothetical protein
MYGKPLRGTEDTYDRTVHFLSRLGQSTKCLLSLERTVCFTTKTNEVAYAVTIAPRGQASARHLLAWSRGHWGVESNHWIRDISGSEDICRVRTGKAPQVLAA